MAKFPLRTGSLRRSKMPPQAKFFLIVAKSKKNAQRGVARKIR
jgi:hypothetical protein